MIPIVSRLASRALRRVGVQVVPSAGWDDIVSVAALAGRALRLLGVNPAGPGAAVPPTTDGASVATWALRLAGVNPLGPVPRGGATVGRAELAGRALLKLGAVAAGETPAVADQALAEAKLDAVHAVLTAEGLADWALGAVPLHAAEAYVLATAQMLAPEFGHAADAAAWQAARDMLRAAALDGPAAQAAAEEVLAGVQAGLRARGVIAWAPDRIPLGAAEILAGVVARHLLPRWGRAGSVPGDPTPDSEGEARLRRFALEGAPGQALAAAEVAAVHASLRGRGLVDWDGDRVPLAAADAYASLVAARLAAAYGGTADAAGVQAVAAAAEEAVRRLSINRNAQALAEGKVVAVHAGLDARGRARWTLFDLPDWAEEPYVLMTAALLAPEFGQVPDLQAADRAELELCRATALPSLGDAVAMDAF